MRIPLLLRTATASFALLACLGADAQGVGINMNGATPNANAALDVDVTSLTVKKGMLIPRMTYLQRNAMTLAAADAGMWIYMIDEPVATDPNIQRGLHYWNGTSWVRWASGSSAWRRNGNAPPDATSQWLGTIATSTGKNLLFRVNSDLSQNPQMQIGGTNGFVGLGVPVAGAAERLEINGALRVGNTTTSTEGSIKYGIEPASPYSWHYGFDGTSWKRMENAETLVTPPQPYAKDTLQCLGTAGDMFTSSLTGTGLSSEGNTPFFTSGPTPNFSYRVQYLYKGTELRASGLCTGNITAIAFNLLDDEILTTTPPVAITGQVRMYTQAGPIAAFGNFHDPTQASAFRLQFFNITTNSGWYQLTLTTPLLYTVGQDLVVDIGWSRGTGIGISPRADLQQGVGYNCTRWAKLGLTVANGLMDDSPVSTGPPTFGVTQNRPVTRFTGNIVTPTVTPGTSNYIRYEGGLMVGTAAWAAANYKGPGTVRGQNGVYDGNVQISDHVFDRYFDGQVRPEEAESAAGYAYIGLPELKEHLATERHLPNMPSREEWERDGKSSLGELQTGLWQTVETQALYITQLEQDLTTLETLAFGKDLDAKKAAELLAEVERSPRLTEAQKLHLSAALRQHLDTPVSSPVK